MDDAGGPGDRIRLTVTYNHPLIIPFFQALWPHLKLSHTQDAIVEKFRTARLVGSLQRHFDAWLPFTPTPLPPTDTPTSTATNTATLTPVPCEESSGTGLLARYYAFVGDPNTDPFSNLVYSRIDPVVDFNWNGGSPAPGDARD